MNYATIKTYDTANGPGVRVSLFVSGCTHQCKGCFNPEAWDFNYGAPFTETEEDTIVRGLEPWFIRGLSLLGGEPFEPSNQQALLPLLRKVRKAYPEKRSGVIPGMILNRIFLRVVYVIGRLLRSCFLI